MEPWNIGNIVPYNPALFKEEGIEYTDVLSIAAIVNRAEEEILKKILREILQREPTIEDAKDCTLFFSEGNLSDFDIAYKGVKMGSISMAFKWNEATKVSSFEAIFTPTLLK